jgi:hypothetical protein
MVKIRENALRKIDRYSQLAPEVFKEVYETTFNESFDELDDIFGSFELYGYTCRFKDRDITEDCFIGRQAAYEDFVHISTRNVSDALAKVRKLNPDYKIDGHFHKHPELCGVSPSWQDMGNIEVVLANSAATKIHNNHKISYSNMIITNGSKHYAMIADIRPCGVIDKRTAMLKVLPGGPEVVDDFIRKEIRENINVPRISIGKIDTETLRMEIRRTVSKPNIKLKSAEKKKIKGFIKEVGLEKVIQYLQSVS